MENYQLLDYSASEDKQEMITSWGNSGCRKF